MKRLILANLSSGIPLNVDIEVVRLCICFRNYTKHRFYGDIHIVFIRMDRWEIVAYWWMRRWDWASGWNDLDCAGSLWGVWQCNFRYTKNARTAAVRWRQSSYRCNCGIKSALTQKSSPRGWFCVKQTYYFGAPSWVLTTRAVHFMGNANKTSDPIFKCGVGARYPLT